MGLEVGPRLVGVGSFPPIEDHIFKLASLLDVVERFAHCGGFGDGIVACGSKTSTFLDANP